MYNFCKLDSKIFFYKGISKAVLVVHIFGNFKAIQNIGVEFQSSNHLTFWRFTFVEISFI